MKSISPYSGICIDFFEAVLTRKRTKKNLLTGGVIGTVKDAYGQYQTLFKKKALEQLSTQNFSKEEREQLEGLYSYRSKKLAELRGEIIESNQLNFCPCCTIVSEARTLDHIVPKSEFHEFAVHPLNLIPCCSTCNGKKGATWKSNGRLAFLNLYQDKIPDKRFLFVSLSISKGKPHTHFHISNDSNIEPMLYERIKAHYDRLELCERFDESSAFHFGTINTIFSAFATSSAEELMSILKTMAENELKKEGNNYWVGILYEACAHRKDIVEILRLPQKKRKAK